MILIISSSHSYDQGTESVIDWLNFLKRDFLRISLEDIYSGKHDVLIDVFNNTIVCDGIDILADVNVVFFRKKEFLQSQKCNSSIEKDLLKEKQTIIDYIFNKLQSKVWFPNYSHSMENKLLALGVAKNNGIHTPETIVTSRKKDVISFNDKFTSIINKPIHFCDYHHIDNQIFTATTVKLDKEKINQLPNNFALSLFQEAIVGDFELRCFYLDGELYTTAIIHDAENSIDVKLNRNSPKTFYSKYVIDDNYKNIITSIMKDMNLNTGSIDLIKKNNDLYFLEVNPVGQFLFESDMLNFNLEKKIAEWLTKMDNNTNE